MKVGPRIYKHTDGRWEVRYRKGRRPDGSILYGSVYGATYEEAEKRRAEILRELALRAENGDSAVAAVDSNREMHEYYASVPKGKAAYPAPLDEDELSNLMPYIRSCGAHLRLAVYLSLYMGVSAEELAALRYSDMDQNSGKLHISRFMTDARHMPGIISPCETRTVSIPKAVRDSAELVSLIRDGGNRYILTDAEVPVRSLRTAKFVWTKLFAGSGSSKKITPEVLRATFIRHCFERGINAETAAQVTGLAAPVLRTKYGRYAGANPELPDRLELSAEDREVRPRQMNLLIFGAGAHGHAVYEIAEKLGIFQKIAFLDDRETGDQIIGRIEDCENFTDEYPMCFLAVRNNELRKKLAERVAKAGFITPRLISPETSVARGIHIGCGTIIMPQATVNNGATIGDFCIVESNALIGFHAAVENYAHCDCASVVMKDCVVRELETVESGEIVKEKRS